MRPTSLVAWLAGTVLLLATLLFWGAGAGASLPPRTAALAGPQAGMLQEPGPGAPGQVSGTVLLNRSAEGTDVPASGALVTLESSLGTTEVLTQPDGSFAESYPNGQLPLAVTVTAAYTGYLGAQSVAMVYPSQVTTLDLALELAEPWIQTSPAALEAALQANSEQTATLEIGNLGPVDLIVSLIEEIPAGTAPATQADSRVTTWVDRPFSVDGAVVQALQAPDATSDFFIWLRPRADLSRAPRISDKETRRRYVFEALSRTADRTQAGIRRYLEGRGLAYEVFWINNSILVRAGDQAVVEAMRARGDVARLRGVYDRMSIPDPEQLAIVTAEQATLAISPTWNIVKVNAPQVWEQLGITGQGVVVANIDTGVRYTHEALVGSYRGNVGDGTFDHNYNWGALYGSAPTACYSATYAPCDWSGHGTHTMGTMAGGDGDGPAMEVGMAPGARWMACLGCDLPAQNQCSDEALTGCAQWIIAPLDLNGLNPDPSMAPDVVNNSWGGSGGDDWYYSFIEAWHAANIIPTFSAGNSGPNCSTLSSPGDYA
ncbi:MAG: S8 family serine peptidase, partial [Anaerolineae bacterium]|nr:S8 family serine peptidase [Anaerolineae bacterium]